MAKRTSRHTVRHACTRGVEMRCPSQRQQQNPRHQRKPLLLVLRAGHVLTRICTLSTFGGRGLGVRFWNFSINAAICCRPLAKASRSSRRRLLPGGDKRRSAAAPTSAVAAHPKRILAALIINSTALAMPRIRIGTANSFGILTRRSAQRPLTWHSRAGGGAVHSITSGGRSGRFNGPGCARPSPKVSNRPAATPRLPPSATWSIIATSR